MSTIGILTMHRPLNFGCTLQAFATQEVLERLGHQVKMIDYLYPNASRDHRINLRHALLHAGNRLLAFFLTGQAFSRREQQYRDFLQQRLHLTQEYATKEAIAIPLFAMGATDDHTYSRSALSTPENTDDSE